MPTNVIRASSRASRVREVTARVLYDAFVFAASVFAAEFLLSTLRISHLPIFSSESAIRSAVAMLLGVLTLASKGVYTGGRTYRVRIKAERTSVAVAYAYVTIGFALFVFGDRVPSDPTALAIAFLISLIGCVAGRVAPAAFQAFDATSPRRIDIRHRRGNVERVLVVGGAGYIGSSVVQQLVAQGYTVRVLDRFLYGLEPLKSFLSHSNVEIQRGDFRDVSAVVRAVRGVDCVVHLGAIVGDPACALDESATIDVNLTATRMVAEAARGAGVERFVFASTCSVYGASDETLDEQSRLNPVSLYARSKIAAEQVLLQLRNDSFHPVILRFGTIYGLSGRTRFDLVANVLVAKALAEGRIPVYGPNQWRPFVHVDDAARAVIAAIEARETLVEDPTFNVGSDEQNLTLGDLGALVKQVVPSAQLELSETLEDRRNYRVSFRRIRDVLHFRPKWTIEMGLRQVADAITRGEVSDYRDPMYSNVRVLTENQLIEVLRPEGDWGRAMLATLRSEGDVA